MRIMTHAEQKNVLEVLSHAFTANDMMLFDAICYGGQLEEYRDARNGIEKVIEAFPADIRKDYDASLRKAAADKLRAQADAIEAGEQA